MKTHLTLSMVLLLGLAGLAEGGVQIPQYTPKQLQDKDYVNEQLVTFTKMREELATKYETAGPLLKMTVEKDLQRVDTLLEALKYVEANGYDAKDPKLAQLPYFSSSAKPVGEGFHHNIRPAGPPGGRVSYMDGKPAQTGKPSQTGKPADKEETTAAKVRRKIPVAR